MNKQDENSSGKLNCDDYGCLSKPTAWHRDGKLAVFNWLKTYGKAPGETDIVEVRFKNTRKAYFRNVNHLNLEEGDVVAVEASPGHDIGIVSLTGELIYSRLKNCNIERQKVNGDLKKIYRKAKPADIEKWKRAITDEKEIMLKARQIANDLKLNMKIGDVEFQGDHTKAIFYYIADERVDFRELIKVLAETFRIRVEMRQIGARQEAGRIGGIGSCGRELCCATFMTNFNSVTTNSARYQELSLNPQKLAGQCSKLKCCLNYELDAYMDAQRDFPKTNQNLETQQGTFYYMKTDIFNRIMWYSAEPHSSLNITPVPVDRVKEILELNKKNQKPDKLVEKEINPVSKTKNLDYTNVVGQESLTRFDDINKKKKRKKRRKKPQQKNSQQSNNQQKKRHNTDNRLGGSNKNRQNNTNKPPTNTKQD